MLPVTLAWGLLAACVSPPGAVARDARAADAAALPDAPDAASTTRVHVDVSGPGVVTSSPAGIACPPSCDAAFTRATPLTLVPSPEGFVGFTGACTGATCSLVLQDDVSVGARFAGAGDVVWWRRFGADGREGLYDAAWAANGNIVVAGDYSLHPASTGTVDVGLGPLPRGDGDESYVARYGADGAPEWVAPIVRSHRILPLRVAGAPAGGALVSGSFEQALDLVGDPVPAGGPGDLFVAGYSTTGVALWQVPLHTDDNYADLAVTPEGDAVVLARIGPTSSIGATSVAMPQGGMLLARLSGADGTIQWLRQLEWIPDAPYAGRSLAVDESGEIFLAGSYVYQASVGCAASSAIFGSDAYVARLHGEDGACVWSWSFGTDAYEQVPAMDARGGHVALALYAGKAFDIGGRPVAEGANLAVFAALDGSLEWVRRAGTYVSIQGVAVDGAGAVNAAGSFDEALDLVEPPRSAPTAQSIFAVRLQDGATLGATVFAVHASEGYPRIRAGGGPGALLGFPYRGDLVVDGVTYTALDVDFVLARLR